MTALAEDVAMAAPEIEVLRQSPLWSGEPEAETIVVRAIRTAAKAVAIHPIRATSRSPPLS